MANLTFTPGLLLLILFLLIAFISWGSYAFKRAGNNSLLKDAPSGAPLSIFFFLLIMVFMFIYFRQISGKSTLVSSMTDRSFSTREMGIRMTPDIKPIENKHIGKPLISTSTSRDTSPGVQPRSPISYYDNEYTNVKNVPTRMVQKQNTAAKPNWSQGYAVQAGAFYEEATAIKLALELYKVFDLPIVWVEGTDRKGKLCYRVLIGVFEDKQLADRFARELPRYNFREGFKVDLTEMKLVMM